MTLAAAALIVCAVLAPAAAEENVLAGSPNSKTPHPHLRGRDLGADEVLLVDDSEPPPPSAKSGGGFGFPKLAIPFPPLPPHVDPGVTFSRSIKSIEGGSEFRLRFGPDENHCKSADGFGDNECHYSWGDALDATYDLRLETEMVEGDTISGEFKIDTVVPWSFSCQVCGEDCTLEAPVINQKWRFPMDPCPIPAQNVTHTISTVLQGHSPVEGIRTHVQGNLRVMKNSGDTIATFSVDVFIK